VDWLAEMRATKTREEIETLQDAAQVTVNGMEKAAELLRAGIGEVTAFDIAAATESLFKKHGCTNAFHTAGPGDNLIQVNAEAPHTALSGKTIAAEDVVIVDIGARSGMYCMDMARTFCRDPSDMVRDMFAAVKDAQETCIEMLEPGVECSRVDTEARDVLQSHGFDPDTYFLHSVGHGVGINVHEKPRLAQNSGDVLEQGYVVTVEPGLYVPEVGGVRIEDTLLITENGAEDLTGFPKQLQL
jgi:Xaa-Pro aminopeptidase